VLAGVAVNAQHAATGLTRVAVTNAAGLAQFADIPAGAWQVRVTLGGFSTAMQNATVPAGGIASVTLTLSRTTGGFGGIIGVLVDDSGIPLPGEIVQIFNAAGVMQSVLTGPDGSYGIDGLPPGEYRVVTEGGGGAEIPGVQIGAGGKQYIAIGIGGG